ncbi:acyltransferase [Rhodovulum sp. FJ3]|uniref:acyltransferase family protein n=1 Tax=Rhodovulum sp. FJ3 TaxID=3079053 RepID=UPI00293DF97C|nr:acyltransferase [Rhodovulum sp. FJ3]MDV4166756.1 acyltransferase [Rhodovulum sp. FJ3]
MITEERPMVERQTLFSIQFLRGVAAALVLVEHLRIETGLAPYGAVGVDIFFAISGFIIFFVTREDRSNFYLKRIIRIVPLYWLATFAIAAVAVAKPSLLNNASFSISHLIQSLFFVPHFTQAQELRPLLALGWTLNFEIMFYLLFGLGMVINHKRRFEITSVLLIILWAVTNLLPLTPQDGLAFYRSPIMFEFIFGMAIARFWPVGKRASVPNTLVMLGLGIAAFLAITIWRPTGVRVVDNGIPAALIFMLFLWSEPLFSKTGLLRRASVFGGEISYALYLTHIYFLAAFARVLHLEGVTLWIVCLLAIPAIAWAVYRVVEAPMTHWLRRRLLG